MAALRSLLNLVPDTAIVVRDGKEISYRRERGSRRRCRYRAAGHANPG